MVMVFSAMRFRKRDTLHVPGRAGLPAAALSRPHRADARPGWRGALRGLQPVRGRLPGRLYFAAKSRNRRRSLVSGVLPDQLLALHFLRHVRRGLPDHGNPADAGFRNGRVQRQNLVYEKEDLLIAGPGKYHDYNFYRVSGMAIAGKPKGAAQRKPSRSTSRACCPKASENGNNNVEIAFLHRRHRRRLATLRRDHQHQSGACAAVI
jgi:hypothetical protein